MVDKDSICGRDNEREEILSQLKQTHGNENVSIISIVGLGGLGKTTLAQLVYNNEDDLKGYFYPKIWVYVSQDFNAGRIVRASIESMSQIKSELENLDVLAKQLATELTGKRFLLVLDDIWNENQEDWEKLKVVFNSGISGSKIIATTRSMKVSQVMKSTSIFVLEGLSEQTSWTLFKQNAFSGSDRGLNSQILEIAKEIVKKCGGVPLALKVLRV
ncbi:Disease resistance protein (CC-NBS-LRR class) family protein [Rhynchospora pubera]|uniref:Disease resistance protein (CC-NBS-LRR class) family protein n=1 Tax=Rhynchospora pubera TaxID=906938 RepID=A0AAV8F5V0_9POAL|nr:Disease resistance protein (CC-NBS-LRR class) family protein [Rhynchospora pubera]